MPKLRIYLDTSVISHLFHDDTPERKAATGEFFERAVRPKAHDVFISAAVIDELNRTKDAALRAKFIAVVDGFGLSSLPEGEEEVDRLAAAYMAAGIIPTKKPEDALHVAYATVYEMDVLVTWNFRHLAKAKTAVSISGVNRLEGYSKPLSLLTPLEVLEP